MLVIPVLMRWKRQADPWPTYNSSLRRQRQRHGIPRANGLVRVVRSPSSGLTERTCLNEYSRRVIGDDSWHQRQANTHIHTWKCAFMNTWKWKRDRERGPEMLGRWFGWQSACLYAGLPVWFQAHGMLCIGPRLCSQDFRGRGRRKFKAKFGYTASLEPVWDTQDPVSKNNNWRLETSTCFVVKVTRGFSECPGHTSMMDSWSFQVQNMSSAWKFYHKQSRGNREAHKARYPAYQCASAASALLRVINILTR